MRDNLNVARTVLRGNLAANRSLKPNALLAVWQSLFIDEAGQATPQQAVGGIWRSRRTVIVGDPQQLEPVVTLPSSAQHALRRHYNVDGQCTPDITSAQRVADRLARFGTLLPDQGGDSKVWVSAPLRVHRRCDRPIFMCRTPSPMAGNS